MGWENLLGYMLSSLFTQHKVAKGYIFTTALQKDKSNPVLFCVFFGPFSQFWGQKNFFWKIHLCHTKFGFLAPCQKLEKTNNTIPKKHPDQRMDRRTDGQTDHIS